MHSQARSEASLSLTSSAAVSQTLQVEFLCVPAAFVMGADPRVLCGNWGLLCLFSPFDFELCEHMGCSLDHFRVWSMVLHLVPQGLIRLIVEFMFVEPCGGHENVPDRPATNRVCT